MSGLRDQLIKACIIKILSDGKPRSAKELVPMLRANLRSVDIDKHQVNSVLYRDLSSVVQCDRTFNWHIPKKSSLGMEGASSKATPARPNMMRTIHRLRAGLPPCENLESFTVGADRMLGILRGLLKPGPISAWSVVRGDYGGGKTHALTLFGEIARREGYATCHLSADGYANALNHPQRFLPSMLGSLEIPLRETYGYTDLLYDVMSDAHLAERLLSIVTAHLDGWTTMASQARKCLASTVRLLQENEGQSDEWTSNLRQVTYHLAGDSIRHLSAAPGYRRIAYSLLLIARDLLLEMGTKGIAVVIDEAESIYTKLPNARSRYGALRVVAALCEMTHCRVLLAVTPDAHRSMISDVSLTFSDTSALPGENVPRWIDVLKSGRIPFIDCRPLTADQRKLLLEGVRKAYRETYGERSASDEFSRHWHKSLQMAATSQLPVRVVIREAVDLLDSERYWDNYPNGST